MLKQTVTEFTVATRGRGLHEVTHDVAAWVSHSGIRTGLITLHVRHTSASLVIQENADADVRTDLVTALEGEFGVKIPDSDLNPRKFDSIELIDQYLTAKGA